MADRQQIELARARNAVMADMETATTELRQVLDNERAALDQLDSLALDAATSAKAELLQRLESLDGERRQLDAAGSAPEPADAWQDLCEQLKACRHINEVNGAIVEHQLVDVRQALGVLQGMGEGAPTLYGPGGQARTAATARTLSRA